MAKTGIDEANQDCLGIDEADQDCLALVTKRTKYVQSKFPNGKPQQKTSIMTKFENILDVRVQ